MQRILSALSGPRLPLKAAALAFAFGFPSLWNGFFLDDYGHELMFSGHPRGTAVFPSPVRMFSFLSGEPEQRLAGIEAGMFPWWTSDSVRVSFFRPLTSLTHRLDHLIAPHSPAFMHLHNTLWYCVLAAIAAVLYRRFMSEKVGGPVPGVAVLATLLFVVDESHGVPLAWIANRNALVSATFGLAALWFHDRWRSGGTAGASSGVASLVAALVSLALSVLAKEEGLGTTAYLFAYAVFLDRGSSRSRVLSLVPYAAVTLIWRAVYTSSGFGVYGTPAYVDPAGETGRFLAGAVTKVPALLFDLWFDVPCEPFAFAPLAAKAGFAAVGVAAFSFLFFLMRPVLASSAPARFGLTGSLLCLLPAAATFPSDRLLILAGFGALIPLSEWILRVGESAAPGRAARVTRIWMIALHLWISALVLAGTVIGHGVLGRMMVRLYASAPFPEDVAGRDVIIAHSPTLFVSAYALHWHGLQGRPLPRRMQSLSPLEIGIAGMRLERTGERTLRAEPQRGYFMPLFRAVDDPLREGDRVELPLFTAEIIRVREDGRVMVVDYHFEEPLESPRYFWLGISTPGPGGPRFVPFVPPAVGAEARFDP